MPVCQFRVYHGPENSSANPLTDDDRIRRKCVTLPAGDVLSLLADAVDSRRGWLSDFADDEMTISTDLYEVLLAYEHFRRPGA